MFTTTPKMSTISEFFESPAKFESPVIMQNENEIPYGDSLRHKNFKWSKFQNFLKMYSSNSGGDLERFEIILNNELQNRKIKFHHYYI